MNSKIRLTRQIFLSLLLFVYTYTAISKLAAHGKTLNSMQQSPLLKMAALPLSWLLPLVELLLVFALLIPRTRSSGLWASLFLLIAFTIYIGYMLVFVPNLPCSCGGIISALTWKQHLLLNGLLIGINAALIRWNRGWLEVNG